MKQSIFLSAVLSFTVICTSFVTCRAMPNISASAACVIDAESGRVLCEYHAHEKRGMASTTKIMTALVALEQGNLKDVCTVSQNAANTEGTSMYLKPGEEITLEALLYGLMLSSGNDAAVAIAEHVGGSASRFAALMNQKAAEIGLVDTSFQNPNGLTAKDHFTTAYDLAQIARCAMQNEMFRTIVSTKDKRVTDASGQNEHTLHNHNRLLAQLDGCVGIKTGFTKAAGRCLVTALERDGRHLICVTLNDPNDWADHSNLLEWICNEYQAVTIIEKDAPIQSIPVGEGGEEICALADHEFSVLLHRDDVQRIRTEVQLLPIGNALNEGDPLGSLNIFCDAQELGQVTLRSDRAWHEAQTLPVWESWNRLIWIFFTKEGR